MNPPVQQLTGIGPTSAQWLCEVGLTRRADLERIGAAQAYRKVRDHRPMGVSLNLLWALHGSLGKMHPTAVGTFVVIDDLLWPRRAAGATPGPLTRG